MIPCEKIIHKSRERDTHANVVTETWLFQAITAGLMLVVLIKPGRGEILSKQRSEYLLLLLVWSYVGGRHEFTRVSTAITASRGIQVGE